MIFLVGCFLSRSPLGYMDDPESPSYSDQACRNFIFFSLPRAPGNENKLVARSTNLGPNMCATGPKLKVLPTSARRAMCRQGCPGRLGFTTHNKREATIYMDRTINNSVLKLLLYGPRIRINQSYPGNIGN